MVENRNTEKGRLDEFVKELKGLTKRAKEINSSFTEFLSGLEEGVNLDRNIQGLLTVRSEAHIASALIRHIAQLAIEKRVGLESKESRKKC